MLKNFTYNIEATVEVKRRLACKKERKDRKKRFLRLFRITMRKFRKIIIIFT